MQHKTDTDSWPPFHNLPCATSPVENAAINNLVMLCSSPPFPIKLQPRYSSTTPFISHPFDPAVLIMNAMQQFAHTIKGRVVSSIACRVSRSIRLSSNLNVKISGQPWWPRAWNLAQSEATRSHLSRVCGLRIVTVYLSRKQIASWISHATTI